MGEQIRTWLRRGLLVVAAVCAAVAVYRMVENADGEEAYNSAAQIAYGQETVASTIPQLPVEPQETEAPEVVTLQWIPEPVTEEDEHITKLEEIDLNALRQVNPDVAGWVYIPDTKINYPVMQGEDNDFYLNHTWEKVRNGMGSIFLEYRNSLDFTDFNTIIYGHNMNNGSMFGELDKYTSTWFWERNPYVYLVTDNGILRYEVFSYHRAELDSFSYGISFNQKETRDNFIAQALEESYQDMGVVPEYSDRLLTLSTCTANSRSVRWVVHARLKMVLSEPE